LASRTAAQILVDQLKLHGADTAFCVPGESYLALLDALHDANSIRLIVCRQEGGTAMMAEAYGKLTGKPGLCLVTRGPGATNASAGIHVAMQDSTPLIVLVGQVARGARGREALQEIDFRAMFGGMVKWVEEITDPKRIPEYVSRAFHTATSGRPGPVVLSLPEDMLEEPAETGDAESYRRIETYPGAAQMAAMRGLIAKAQRPFLLLGGAPWDEAAVKNVQIFAENFSLPVGTAFRRQDRIDNRHANYAGDVGIGPNAKLAERIKAADLLIALGARLGETTTGGYALVEAPVPRQKLVHIHADPEELGRVYHPTLAINASPIGFAEAAAALAPLPKPVWAETPKAAHAEYLDYIKPVRSVGNLQMSEVIAWLDKNLPEDAIVANGAGNFAAWVSRFHQYRRFGTQLAPTSGSMGYGFPAAVAAKLVHPEREVICFCGDGDFLMTGQELATAAKHRLRFVTLIVNNGMYGTIRMHQEMHYPGRVTGTDLHNPDFTVFAQAFGAYGEVVTKTEDFAAAYGRARAFAGPAILELRVDPAAITHKQSIDEIRDAARAKQKH
jgi:acetolactate synthase-1/2/3 large subunit